MSKVFHILQRLLNNGRLPPVIIIQGSNKETHAFFKEWEKLCVCNDLKSCGACEGCMLLQHDAHPDMIWIQAPQIRHAIKIEQIRDLQQQCIYTPQMNSFMNVFIEGADGLNAFSANALLKILEEPLGKVYFFLSTETPSLLPKTILSRSWQFKIQQGQAISADTAARFMSDSDSKTDILNQYPQMVVEIQNYLQQINDVTVLVRFFEPFVMDDVVWILQFYTLHVMEILQSENPSIAPEWISAISIPPPVWWQFWDALIQLRQQLRLQSSLQVNLQLTRLFLILHGLK